MLGASTRLLRWSFYLTAAAFDATLAYTLVFLISTFLDTNPVIWPVLWGVVLVAALSVARWAEGAPARTARIGMVVAALAVTSAATWLQLTLRGLLQPASSPWAGGFVALVTSLWCWWRGLGLLDREHDGLVLTLRRGIITLAVVGTLASWFGGMSTRTAPEESQLLVAVVSCVGLGLTSLVLARIVSDEAMQGDRLRWLRSGLGAVAAIILVGLGTLTLIASPAATVLKALLTGLILVLTVVLSPLIWLAYTLVQGALALVYVLLGAPHSQEQITSRAPLEKFIPDPSTISEAVASIPTVIIAAAPIILLLVVIVLFSRRRPRVRGHSDEQRESLFSWAVVGDDLRGLWQRRAPSGLQALLATLTSSDPITRIRRRYVQTLLLGVQREQPRQPPQTPAEYTAVLGAKLPAHRPSLQALTTLYERARYHPESVTDTDAAAADTLWQQLDPKES